MATQSPLEVVREQIEKAKICVAFLELWADCDLLTPAQHARCDQYLSEWRARVARFELILTSMGV